MQKNDFNNPSSWVGNGFESMKRMQIAMIKKAYPDYQEDKDYVLWVIPDFYHPYACDKVTAKINILKSSNNAFGMSEIRTSLLFSYKTRQPYPNKNIYQLSLVPSDKRKQIYGIPLIFHSFDELKEISSVSIDWTVYDTDPACSVVYASHLFVNYHVSFSEDIGNEHFFTLFTYDRLDYAFGDKEAGDKKHYYEQFKIALSANGIINLYDDPDDKVRIIDVFDLSSKPAKYKGMRKTSEEEKVVISQFHSIRAKSSWFPDVIYMRELCEAHHILEAGQYLLQYLCQDVILSAADAADFVPEPAFGFKEV